MGCSDPIMCTIPRATLTMRTGLRAYREDLQATGLLTPDATPWFPLVWRAECAYQDWKWTVDLLWEAARRRQQQLYNKLEEAARQKCLHDKHHQCLLTSVPPKHATRPFCDVNALLPKRPPWNERWPPREPSSCGFAVDVATSGSPARPRGDCNMRPLLPACNMSKNAVRARLSLRRSDNRSLQRV